MKWNRRKCEAEIREFLSSEKKNHTQPVQPVLVEGEDLYNKDIMAFSMSYWKGALMKKMVSITAIKRGTRRQIVGMRRWPKLRKS